MAGPDKGIYAVFGMERGNLLQMFGPGVWAGNRHARAKGNTQGKWSGNIWMMPGCFLVDGPRVLWAHEYAHAADLPDFAGIPDQIS